MKLLVGIAGGCLWFLLGFCAWAGEDSKSEDLLDVLRHKQNKRMMFILCRLLSSISP